MVEAAGRVAADTMRHRAAEGTIQRRVVEDITPAAGALSVGVAGTPPAADIRVGVAAMPAVEDMAAAIAKKLGDGMSLREAAT